jgi:predicted nucleic acid-binding protein
MRLVIDTNRYTDLMAGVTEAVETIEAAAEILVPFVVLAEFRGGFAGGNRRAANDKILDAFLQKPFVKPIFADGGTVAVYAELHASLRRSGRAIPHNDIWISALCVQHAASLYSRDGHFDYLRQVKRV